MGGAPEGTFDEVQTGEGVGVDASHFVVIRTPGVPA